jgi:hypothetical protein
VRHDGNCVKLDGELPRLALRRSAGAAPPDLTAHKPARGRLTSPSTHDLSRGLVDKPQIANTPESESKAKSVTSPTPPKAPEVPTAAPPSAPSI